MAKTKRGKGIKTTPGWRGMCPTCSRKRVKVLWTTTRDGKSLKVCKACGSN